MITFDIGTHLEACVSRLVHVPTGSKSQPESSFVLQSLVFPGQASDTIELVEHPEYIFCIPRPPVCLIIFVLLGADVSVTSLNLLHTIAAIGVPAISGSGGVKTTQGIPGEVMRPSASVILTRLRFFINISSPNSHSYCSPKTSRVGTRTIVITLPNIIANKDDIATTLRITSLSFGFGVLSPRLAVSLMRFDYLTPATDLAKHLDA